MKIEKFKDDIKSLTHLKIVLKEYDPLKVNVELAGLFTLPRKDTKNVIICPWTNLDEYYKDFNEILLVK